MAVDYDLVVIGASAAGMTAAVTAARWKARVALVDQGLLADGWPEPLDDQVVLELGQILQQGWRAEQFGISEVTEALNSLSSASLGQQATRWIDRVRSTLKASHAAAVLATTGIEVIAGCGEFYRKPALGFTVNGRSLRSRAYLLATVGRPRIPEIEGLETTGYVTSETVLQLLTALEPPASVVVIGSDPAGVELAQALNQLGFQVTMIIGSAHLLPEEDPEAAYLLQAQLEAEGVQLLTKTRVSQVRQIQGKKWVQAGNVAIEADEILLATGLQPHLESLNLEAAKVRWSADGIEVNRKLQTSNSRIYACSGQVGSRYASHWATAQARVAVKNALFLPLTRVSDRSIPRVVRSSPELARVGLTEPEAVRQYGKEVLILRQSLSTITKAVIQGETTGFCKLIVRRNGEILGAHMVGPHASELITTIALAMQQHQPIQALVTLMPASLTFSELIRQTADDWQRLRLERHRALQDLLEGLFNLQRSWS